MSADKEEERRTIIGLEPIITKDTRVLILGSFPSVISLEQKQYYANPRNIFWKIIKSTFNRAAGSYDECIALLKQHQVGLWDIYHDCERKGSLDSDIKNGKKNDFESLKRIAPSLKRICLNGMKAGSHSDMFRKLGYETLVLPSTSPANAAMPYAQKERLWDNALAR